MPRGCPCREQSLDSAGIVAVVGAVIADAPERAARPWPRPWLPRVAEWRRVASRGWLVTNDLAVGGTGRDRLLGGPGPPPGWAGPGPSAAGGVSWAPIPGLRRRHARARSHIRERSRQHRRCDQPCPRRGRIWRHPGGSRGREDDDVREPRDR